MQRAFVLIVIILSACAATYFGATADTWPDRILCFLAVLVLIAAAITV